MKNNLLLLVLSIICISNLSAQRLDVPYVRTPYEVVDAMLKIADVGQGDYVIDLGSGDGRIVIGAVKRGAFGHGVDIDQERITEAYEKAKIEDVQDKVIFLRENIFETDFSKATVVTMYLLSSINERLRPNLFEQLKPGTRVVSHDFDMGDWKPDQELTVEIGRGGYDDLHYVFFWIIPAKVEGSWEWAVNKEIFSMRVEQKYQNIKINLTCGNEKLEVKNPVLIGDRISFSAYDKVKKIDYVFSGTVEGNDISGIVQIRTKKGDKVENWSAKLK